MSKIALRNITKYYGKQLILDNISLDIRDGEFLCITGPSGCGKTTLLRIIAGLDTDHSGKIYFDDIDSTNLRPSERNISMVFREYALYPNLIAKEKISQKLKSTVEMIDVGVDKYLYFFPKELSAGHRQRVATGRAIIRDKPRVLLMDEPLSNLDAKIKMNTKTYLKKLVTKLDTTTIYVTSDSSEAMALADRIGVLNDGMFVQVDSPQNIYHYPKNMFTADFFGTLGMNFINGTAKDNKFYFDYHVIDIKDYTNKADLEKLLKEPKLILGIRPENINFSIKPLKAGIKVKVDSIQKFPPKASIKCKFGNHAINVICFMEDLAGLQKNTDIYLDFDKSKILLFYARNGELVSPGSQVFKTEQDFPGLPRLPQPIQGPVLALD